MKDDKIHFHLSVAPERKNRMNGVNIILNELMTENFEKMEESYQPLDLRSQIHSKQDK